VNHVLNIKKSKGEMMHASNFGDYGRSIDATPDRDLPDPNSVPIDMNIIVEEVKLSCMFGMLLCLDREQRMIYILGGILGVSDVIGGEIMEINRDNFRQKLSRARRDLFNFMHDKCGLIDAKNPCRCSKKTKALIDSGYVNPIKLRFNRNYFSTVAQAAGEHLKDMKEYLDNKCQVLFDGHPFQKSPDFVLVLRKILETDEFKDIFNLNMN
jgi:hypothetical protein